MNMPGADARIKLADRFQALMHAPNDVQLVSLYESLRVTSADIAGEVLALVFERLQRGTTLQELLDDVAAPQHEAVVAIVRDLHARRLLHEAPAAPQDAPHHHEAFREQARFFANFRVSAAAPPTNGAAAPADVAAAMQHALGEAAVLVIGLGRLGARLAAGLAHAGVGRMYCADPGLVTADDLIDSGYDSSHLGQRRETALVQLLEHIHPQTDCRALGQEALVPHERADVPEGIDLLIMCEDAFDPEHYRAVNRLCLDRNLSWISGRSVGARVEVGPLIVPRETACYTCLEQRKTGNLAFYESLLATQHLLASAGMSLGRLNITLGYEVLALEVIKILTGFSRPLTYGSVYTFDPVTLEGKLHPVLKIPRCPACSPAADERPGISIWNADALFDSH